MSPPQRRQDIDQSNLFRAFQANLLSLISHELRTPLTGVLNALGVLGDGMDSVGGLTSQDWIRMARENALRLQQALSILLDLGSLQSQSYHVQLREIDFCRLVRSRFEKNLSAIRNRQLQPRWMEGSVPLGGVVLGDPQKLVRAVDLCFQILLYKGEPGSSVELNLTTHQFEMQFDLARTMGKLFETAGPAEASEEGRGQSGENPYAAFSGIMQPEQGFLSRVEDGFGSEFMLIHEIMQQHHGKFLARLEDIPHSDEDGSEPHASHHRVRLILSLPDLTHEESLNLILSSRAFQISTELTAVALVLIQLPAGISSLKQLEKKVREHLPNSTDAVYSLVKKKQLALVLSNRNRAEVDHLIEILGKELGLDLEVASAQSPEDTFNPGELVRIAEGRFK